MRNLKFIIATIALGLLASCSVDENDIAKKINENCGCESRTTTTTGTWVTHEIPPSVAAMQLWEAMGAVGEPPQPTIQRRLDTETIHSGWYKVACTTPGTKVLGGGIRVTTRCN